MLWDRALGYHYIPLPGVSYASEVNNICEFDEHANSKKQQQQPHEQASSVNLESSSQEHQPQPLALPETQRQTDTLIDTNSNTQEYLFRRTVHIQTLHAHFYLRDFSLDSFSWEKHFSTRFKFPRSLDSINISIKLFLCSFMTRSNFFRSISLIDPTILPSSNFLNSLLVKFTRIPNIYKFATLNRRNLCDSMNKLTTKQGVTDSYCCCFTDTLIRPFYGG